MDVGADAFGAQSLEDRRPIEMRGQTNNVEMIAVRHSGSLHERLNRWLAGKSAVILCCDFLAAPHPGGKLAQLREPERAVDIGKPVVIPELRHLVKERALLFALAMVSRNAVIAEHAQTRREVRAVSDDYPTLARRDRLDRMQAEGAEVGQRAHRAALIGAPERMTGVCHESGVMFAVLARSAG